MNRAIKVSNDISWLGSDNKLHTMPYYYGFFPYIREKMKGTKNIAWYGFEDGLWSALFIDWGDERDLKSSKKGES